MLVSTPIYDAVAVQDTITLIRSAIRALLRAAERSSRVALQELISSGGRLRGHGQIGHRLD